MVSAQKIRTKTKEGAGGVAGELHVMTQKEAYEKIRADAEKQLGVYDAEDIMEALERVDVLTMYNGQPDVHRLVALQGSNNIDFADIYDSIMEDPSYRGYIRNFLENHMTECGEPSCRRDSSD